MKFRDPIAPEPQRNQLRVVMYVKQPFFGKRRIYAAAVDFNVEASASTSAEALETFRGALNFLARNDFIAGRSAGSSLVVRDYTETIALLDRYDRGLALRIAPYFDAPGTLHDLYVNEIRVDLSS